ncbi:hypothetical protein N0V88_000152 [Collariella sp. IMI 366227]|nr:hypothetical protein N0V88_000152 [Collariella sp. IMI 366227]
MERPRRDADLASSGCECYFNTAEIKQGAWQEDPSVCLRNCRAQFMRSALKGWDDASGWDAGCKSLNSSVPVHDFWSLYWCDSTFCGVGIDQNGGLWQDQHHATPYIHPLNLTDCDNGPGKAHTGRGSFGLHAHITHGNCELSTTTCRSINNLRQQTHRARQGRSGNMRRTRLDRVNNVRPTLPPTT